MTDDERDPMTHDFDELVTAEEHLRTMTAPGGRVVSLHDVVVRATRRP